MDAEYHSDGKETRERIRRTTSRTDLKGGKKIVKTEEIVRSKIEALVDHLGASGIVAIFVVLMVSSLLWYQAINNIPLKVPEFLSNSFTLTIGHFFGTKYPKINNK